MSNDVLVRFGKRFAEVDNFAHLVYCRGNYYARQAAKLSEAELTQKLKEASKTIDYLCMEHAVMADLLENSSMGDRTPEEASDRVMKLLATVLEARRKNRHEREGKKAAGAAATLAAQEILSGGN